VGRFPTLEDDSLPIREPASQTVLFDGATLQLSGFTRACRYLLTEANRPLNSSEICEELCKKFPEVASRHKDPTASVTTVLNRLVAYGEAVPSKDSQGRRAWQWVADEKWVGVPPIPAIGSQRIEMEN